MPGKSKKGGGLEVKSAYKMKGWSGYQNSPVKQKQKYEGAETMTSETLRDKWGVEGLDSSADYYIKRGKQGEPMILGEVDLEGKKVVGVPGRIGGKLERE